MHAKNAVPTVQPSSSPAIAALKDRMQLPLRPNTRRMDERWAAWTEARRQALSDRRWLEITVSVKIQANTWGMLCETALIHGCTPEEALQIFVEASGLLCEWVNDGSPTQDELTGM